MVWTRGKNERKNTIKCSIAWACDRRKKQRKAKQERVNNVREDLDETDMQLSTAYEKTKNR